MTDQSADTQSLFKALALQEGLDIAFLSDSAEDANKWRDVQTQIATCPHNHTLSITRYQTQMMVESYETVTSLNMLISDEGQPIGIWPICLVHQDKQNQLLSNAAPLALPLFKDSLGEKKKRKLTKACFTLLNNFAREIGVGTIETDIVLDTVNQNDWLKAFLESGAIHKAVHYDLGIDLTQPLSTIRSGIRKSFRNLIKQHQKQWQIETHTQCDEALFEEFQDKHVEVAGRVTRSKESWELQRQCINAGEAFAITLRGENGSLGGFALIFHSHSQAFYGVGVYDRSLSDKPLGHIVQDTAIQTLQDKGVTSYLLGDRFYPGAVPQPSDKEISIAFFKEGFSSFMQPRVKLNLEVKK